LLYTCFKRLLTCALTRLTTDDFSFEANTLTLVRLWHTEGANLRAHLTEELLISAGEDDQRVLVTLCLRLYLNLLGELKIDVVREAEAQLEQLTLIGCTITDTHELKSFGEALRHTYDHIMDKRTIEPVERAILTLVTATAYYDVITLYGYSDASIESLC
jgi:hypothetical protein